MRRRAIADCLLGLAAGDLLSWTTADHREPLISPRARRTRRSLEQFGDDTGTTTIPRPHVHAAPAAAMRMGAGDDLEWFAFSCRSQLRALRARGPRDADPLLDDWQELAHHQEGVRARIGTHFALRNLASGLTPPQSGHDNPHYFDDIASVRSVAAGLVRGDPAAAVAWARRDAETTHSLDGVWCAEATAALVASLASGHSRSTALDAAMERLPPGSWSRRLAELALAVAEEARSPFDLTVRLHASVADTIYSYGVAAPDTVALLLGHTARASDPLELMAGALGHGRNADALPALAGAVAGLMYGSDWTPDTVRSESYAMEGVCLPHLAGVKLHEVIADVGHAAATPSGRAASARP
jgi:ADP-ribosylglycohydrolase